MRKFCYRHFLAQGHYGIGTFRYKNISAHISSVIMEIYEYLVVELNLVLLFATLQIGITSRFRSCMTFLTVHTRTVLLTKKGMAVTCTVRYYDK